MNNLIGINEKDLNYENKFISKLKSEKKMSGCGCCENDIKPITFEGENMVINGSYEFNKIEFYMTKDYFKCFVTHYFYLIYYGEGGQIQEKPIVFMEVFGDNLHKKSIKPLKVRDLYKFIKSKNEIKVVIYFETAIQKDPEKKLYNVIEPSGEMNNKKSTKYHKKKFFSYEIEEYLSGKDFIEIYEETDKTEKKGNEKNLNLIT